MTLGAAAVHFQSLLLRVRYPQYLLVPAAPKPRLFHLSHRHAVTALLDQLSDLVRGAFDFAVEIKAASAVRSVKISGGGEGKARERCGAKHLKSAMPWLVPRYVSTRRLRSCTSRMVGLEGRALVTPEMMFLMSLGRM
jgi:hypothetical protein